MIRNIGIAIVMILVLSAGTALAEETDCSMCHPDKSQGKVVHPAVGMGCTTCHSGVADTSSIPHKMTGTAPKGLLADGAELCFSCHDKSKFSGKTSVHMPVAGGMCTSCHNPHAGDFPSLLLSDGICFNCHDKAMFTAGKSVHVPAGEGMCTSCHNPHQSDFEKMLQSEVPALCYNCHDKTKFYGPTIHAPVGIGLCTACHSPHRSENRKLLTTDETKICYNCHDKSEFVKRVVHKPVLEGKCGSCHDSHASQNRSLVYRRGNVLCRKCHPTIEQNPHAVSGFTGKGHPVHGRKDPNRPGRTFECLSCHVPHSSNWLKLFRYKAVNEFDLCVNCHDM